MLRILRVLGRSRRRRRAPAAPGSTYFLLDPPLGTFDGDCEWSVRDAERLECWRPATATVVIGSGAAVPLHASCRPLQGTRLVLQHRGSRQPPPPRIWSRAGFLIGMAALRGRARGLGQHAPDHDPGFRSTPARRRPAAFHPRQELAGDPCRPRRPRRLRGPRRTSRRVTSSKPRPLPSPAARAAVAPTKSVRVTVDLADGDYERLRTWAISGRVTGSDIIRAAIAHLADNRPGLDDVLGRARTAKTERDRRRLGK